MDRRDAPDAGLRGLAFSLAQARDDGVSGPPSTSGMHCHRRRVAVVQDVTLISLVTGAVVNVIKVAIIRMCSLC